MIAALLAAGAAALLTLTAAGRGPWRARRDRREAVELAAWAAYRAAFEAPLPARVERTRLELPAPRRPARSGWRDRGPRFYVVRQPVD